MCATAPFTHTAKHIHMMQKKPLDTRCEREGGREDEIMMMIIIKIQKRTIAVTETLDTDDTIISMMNTLVIIWDEH